MHNCSYSNLQSFNKSTLEEAKLKMQILSEKCQISNAPFIQQIVDFINIDDPNKNQEGKTAKQIADALCLHPKTLNKLLKNSISKNPCVQLVAQREGRVFQYKYRFSSQSQSQKMNRSKSPQSFQFPTDLAYQAIIKPEIEKELLEDRVQIQKIEELVIKENLQKRFTYINLIRILFINKMIQSQGAVSQSEIRNQIRQELEQNKSTTEICRKSIKNLLQLMLQIKLIKLAVLKLYQLDGKYEIQIEDFSDIEKLNLEKKQKIKEEKKLQLKKWFGLNTNFDDYESLKKHSEFKFFTRQNQLQIQNTNENLIIEEKNKKNNQAKKQIISESNDEIYLSEEDQKDQEIVKIKQSQQQGQINEQTDQYSIVTLDNLKQKLSQWLQNQKNKRVKDFLQSKQRSISFIALQNVLNQQYECKKIGDYSRSLIQNNKTYLEIQRVQNTCSIEEYFDEVYKKRKISQIKAYKFKINSDKNTAKDKSNKNSTKDSFYDNCMKKAIKFYLYRVSCAKMENDLASLQNNKMISKNRNLNYI